ncbi:hypothetical protein [Sulfuriroseicoccus oceanibius]|uniref:Peptidase S54 rhomboid domain-containing protein n=1 Tax=Sulfuriroseicoccus oceanibius TaxID=2707525 RepID=A0A6B3L8A5_9BACT|nr:hypothetical protein [Sulfuriroseicoccus oceanibius]QQL44340.1 hypothetical protein G3M56_010650 [Sulfuriroseicoccus oceanibius]
MTRRPAPLSDRLVIPGLQRILAGFNVLVYILVIINPHYGQWLELAPDKVLQGQIWRPLTGFLLPTVGDANAADLLSPLSLLFLFIKCQLLIMMGNALEAIWGAKKFNLLVLGTAASVTIATLLTYWINPDIGRLLGPTTSFNLYLVIFFSFASVLPNTEFRLFFVLPVKVKYLAMITGAFVLMTFTGHWLVLVHGLLSYSILLYLLLPELAASVKARHRRSTFERRVVESARNAQLTQGRTCSVCGTTEANSPQREFRVLDNGDDICMPCIEQQRDSEQN